MNAKREKEVLISQLVAARAQIDATLAVLLPEECEHPAESVVDLSTFGGEEKYHCNQCGQDSDKPFNPPEG